MFGQNIRITTNALLQALIDSNNTEGIVTPVAAPVETTLIGKDQLLKDLLIWNDDGTYKVVITDILATASIGDIGAIILKYSVIEYDDETPIGQVDGLWAVIRVEYSNGNVSLKLVFKAGREYTTDRKRFSVVINKEIEGLIKLYIADGKHQIMTVDLNGEDYYSANNITVEELISNHLFPTKQVKIVEITSGNLQTQQVQYTYRYYKKHSICSKLAPLTNKIQVIDPNRNKETGNAEDTTTSIGFKLEIPEDEVLQNVFDRIQIFRLSYIKPHQNAEISIIFDGEINNNSNIIVIDDGLNNLQYISVQEFSSLTEMSIVPKIIEQNQNYMFASNVYDQTKIRIEKEDISTNSYSLSSDKKTRLYSSSDYSDYEDYTSENILSGSVDDDYYISKYSDVNIPVDLGSNDLCKYDKDGYYGGIGKNISWKFIVTPINIHKNSLSGSSVTADNPPSGEDQNTTEKMYWIKSDGKLVDSNYDSNKYKEDHNIECIRPLNYNEPITSSLFRSLRRDEVYRYGIVFYNKYGNTTDAMWIQDIRTPSMDELNVFSNDLTDTEESEDSGTTTNTYVEDIIYSNYTLHYHKDSSGYREWIEPSNIPTKNTTQRDISIGNKYKISRSVIVTAASGIDFDVAEYENLTGWKIDVNDKCVIGSEELDFANNTYYTSESNGKLNIKTIGFTATNTEIPHTASEPNSSKSGSAQIKNIKITYTLIIKSEGATTRSSSSEDTGSLYALPIGIQFDVQIPENIIRKYNLVGYQIVRCEKTSNNSHTLLQGVLSKPVKQKIYLTESYSPYYPTGFLTSQNMAIDAINSELYDGSGMMGMGLASYSYPGGAAYSSDNDSLFQFFNPEHLYFRNDTISDLQRSDINLEVKGFLYGNTFLVDGGKIANGEINTAIDKNDTTNTFVEIRNCVLQTNDQKNNKSFNFYDYFFTNNLYLTKSLTNKEDLPTIPILNVSDVKNPTWEEGFSNLLYDGSTIVGGVKQYKSYSTTIRNDYYLNWVCSGMYDLRIGNEAQSGFSEDMYKYVRAFTDENNKTRYSLAKGWIGPGGVYILLKLKEGFNLLSKSIIIKSERTKDYLGTILSNITHKASQYAGTTKQQHQYDLYYGFGNFATFSNTGSSQITIYDGDIYITPHEFVSMFKTYDFQSTEDSLPSAQLVYYVPLESKINSFLDYGMNYKNTTSPNLQLEPGRITGITSQDRPLNQYNEIYFDNNTSNDIFNAEQTEYLETLFPQRTFYSNLKTNGEFIDNWNTFKAADFIDIDSRYGEVTNLLTVNDVIYYWQNRAFGKFSVNERSLISDQNSNTIQLGQGGVLQRNDYIDTTYGIRPQDFSAIAVQNDIYWIDILNKAVVTYKLGHERGIQSVINYGESLNVQNLINKSISEDIPLIHYDVQNNELLCQMLNVNNNEYGSGNILLSKKQLIFNTKYNSATALYTRNYIHCIILNNKLFGINGGDFSMNKFNYIDANETSSLLSPTILSFVVNKNPSTTKVFDNQQVVTLKRAYDTTFIKNYLKDKYHTFTTNIQDAFYGKIDDNKDRITDREGNILYAIPRCNTKIVDKDNKEVLDPYYHETNGAYPMNNEYGRRIRGKWMRVDIRDDNPQYEFAVSHILTKFRQSYS